MCVRMAAIFMTCLAIAAPAFALTPDEAPCAKAPAAEYSSCIATRDYLTLARKVVNGEMDPVKLPGSPEAFRKKFLSKQENDLVNKAVGTSLMYLLDAMDHKQ